MSKLPAIPEPELTMESMRDSVLALKEAIENLAGLRGESNTTAATATELSSLEATLRSLIDNIDLSGYAPLASPTFTGNPQAPTPSANDNDTTIPTTAWVQTELSDYAPLSSPSLTGTPTAPTPSANDNSTKIATTAYVDGAKIWSICKKTADQSVTSSTTLTDDTALQFSMAANKTYAVRACLDLQMGAGGLKIGSNGPGSATRVRVGLAMRNPTGTGSFYVGTGYGSIISFTSPQVAWVISIDAVIQNGSSAGTFAIQFAQSSSNAAATTISKGSYLEFTEIA